MGILIIIPFVWTCKLALVLRHWHGYGWIWDKGFGPHAPWQVLWNKGVGPHAPWQNMYIWGDGPHAPWQVTWTNMHHFTASLHCILCPDLSYDYDLDFVMRWWYYYSWDLLVVILWCYLSSFTDSVAEMRGELGWTYCAYLSIWVVYSLFIVNCWFSWVQVVVLGDGWCGRSIGVLYSLPVFSIFLRVPVDFGTQPCFYTIL